MNWFYNRRIGTKLLLGFGTVCALMAATGAVALYGMRAIYDNTEVIYEKHLRGLHAVDEANVHLVMIGRACRMTVLAKTPEERKRYRTQADEAAGKFLEGIEHTDQYLVTDAAKRVLNDIRAIAPAWVEEMRAIAQLAEAGRSAEAAERLQATIAPATLIVAKMGELRESKFRVSQEAFERATAAHRDTRATMLGVIVGGVAAGLVLGYLIARLIARPLQRSVAILEAVAQGDFTQKLDVTTRDEVGQMAAALNTASESLGRALGETGAVMAAVAAGDFTRRVTSETRGEVRKMAEAVNVASESLGRALGETGAVMVAAASGDLTRRITSETRGEVRKMAEALNAALDKMGSAMREVRASSGAVAEASTQLAAASEEISSGAQEQASSLEECASSLEEMTSAVRQNADNAQQARQLAEGARDAAEKGGKVVTQAVTAMSGINQSSKRIADIITTIDEIAFQTNLLALNAAVEAARAGDQGRGFAVVAAEVRSLAQRAAASAKEIKGLIQDSLRKVEGGSELVNQSGQSLAEIVSAVKRAADIVTEIAAASKEQAAGVEQVSKAVAQMDQVTQANAAQTEELSGTAQGLTGQADQLRDLVAWFKLDDGSADEPVRRTAAAPASAPRSAKPTARPAKPAARRPAPGPGRRVGERAPRDPRQRGRLCRNVTPCAAAGGPAAGRSQRELSRHEVAGRPVEGRLTRDRWRSDTRFRELTVACGAAATDRPASTPCGTTVP
ncbi:HAMP domain-containing methyl-accepting chemotaxis protein [Frigoriglobus tundricola]|uniref:Methyl-accepting chemotaxis protein I (Serine chemoreceptor protein) n=1 Tax=Frigoriglobus tundricola TaxID=2774151 RepID=A0A6M5YZ98_9BACT|nr:methyl-accepting chemotaxis protein [Frigoriglobus tundricola]QJW98242.1 Methyl-accepting chemotaxis protein I (serine chemoreceptor protein) [Frigoriglobus tundricola]